MQLTRRGEYAIRAMVHLAGCADGLAQCKEVAVAQDIPVKFLPQIVVDLSRAGLVHTARGVHGGIRLAGSPETITIRQIVEAIEGPLALNQCLVPGDGCDRMRDCLVHRVWAEAQQSLVAVLDTTSLADLTKHTRRTRR